MTTQQSAAMYRRWRPTTFAELEGQQHVNDTLTKAVQSDRVAQAYLFCGLRGTGKTTAARVLAKAVNCTSAKDGEPCNACPTCQATNEGANLDVIELDAASQRGIDEIREIRDRVRFMPTQSRRKAYIIDEAHMLTAQASNAFLKTLEEPPDHVMFILCTTEAQNILPTIKSRCQRLDFRRIAPATIVKKLSSISELEEIMVEAAALELIASESGGGLRDAENMLDQLAMANDRNISLDDVRSLLGKTESETFGQLAAALISGDSRGAARMIAQLDWEGIDAETIYVETERELRRGLALSWDNGDADDSTDPVAEATRNAGTAGCVRAMTLWKEARGFTSKTPTLGMEVAAAKCGSDVDGSIPVGGRIVR